MRKISLISILIAGFIIFSFAACSGEENNEKSENNSLVMYTLDSGGFFQDSATKFNGKKGMKDIRVETFSVEQYKEYMNKQATELMAGTGPDIITFQAYPNDIASSPGSYPLNSFLKYIPKGVLCDLNELMEKYGGLELPDYNKGALDSGVFNGMRYYIPISFNVDAFLTTEEKLKENHISIDEDNWNWEALLNQVEKYNERSGGTSFFNWRNSYAGLIGNWGTSFIDLGAGQSSFESDEFEALLKTYKSLQGSVTSGSSDDSAIMTFDEIYGFSLLSYSIQRSKGALKAYPVPSGNGGTGGSARPNLAVAVNKNCSDKKAAYEYIKYLLLEDVQLMIPDITLAGFPVNKKAYEQTKERFLEEEATSKELRELVLQVDKIVSGAERYEILDDTMFGIIQANADNYFSNAKSAAEVGISINEGMKKYFGSVTAPAYTKIESNDENKIGEQNEKILKIYYVEEIYEDNIKHVINEYKKVYDKVKLEDIAFSSEENLKTRLTTDILTGEGPDIILFKPNTFNSLHKIMDNGIFASLDELIETDNKFNLSDYYDRVMDCGIYKGKRYFIPIDFYLPVLFTTDRTLKKNGIDIDESNWTWKELAGITMEFMERNEGKDKFMFVNLYPDLTNVGISLVDYINKKSNFNTPEFINYIVNAINADKGTIPAEKYKSLKIDNLWYEVLNGTCVMLGSNDMGNLRNVCFANSWTNHYMDENIRILPLPTVNGDGKSYASPNQCVAINEKCKYKEDAFNMIKLFLSVENQACLSFANSYMSNFGCPVNKSSFASMKEYFKNSEEVKFKSVRKGKLVTHPVEEEVTAQLDRILENLETGYLVDYEILKIAGEELTPYMEGKKTIEEALEDTDKKVELYLSE